MKQEQKKFRELSEEELEKVTGGQRKPVVLNCELVECVSGKELDHTACECK